MNRKITAIAGGCIAGALLLTGILFAQAHTPTSANIQRTPLVALASSPVATDTPTPGLTPTDTPLPTPTDTPTQPPAPTPTPTPSFHTCTSSNGCPNPWNYVLGCSCGNMWQPVTIAPTGFCSYFQCIPGFDSGSGNIMECGDGMMSHALPANCAGHNGAIGVLYEQVTVTPTP